MFREITSLVELNALPGLETGYLLGPDNYASVVRPINLPERDGVCQLLQKCGTACGERFKKGYLLRSKDDVLAMVGSTCGPTHFGIESDRLRRDIALADNRARHARAQDDLRIYLANVEHHTNTLRDAIGSIEEAREKVTRLLDCLAKPAALLLKDAARHGRSSIDITGVVNSNNDQGKTGRAVRIPVGSIAAHEYGNPDNLVRVADDLRAHWKQCKAAKDLDVEVAKTGDLRAANSMFSRLPSVLAKAESTSMGAAKFVANDFRPLCFLLERVDDRNELAYQAMRLLPQFARATRSQASGWVVDQVKEITESAGVDRLLFNDSWRGTGLQQASSVPKGKPRGS